LLKAILEDNPNLTTREIANELNIASTQHFVSI
jgi:predicted transcriptional regulator